MDEICLRCIFHPLQIESSGRLRREALLPAPGRCDVSLQRQDYISLEDCISHGRTIGMNGQGFVAIASITRQDLSTNNAWAMEKDNSGDINGTQADIYYAPMISKTEYADTTIDIYTDSPDIEFPAHADMLYAEILNGTVQTKMRRYASRLVKSMQMVWTDPAF